MEVSVEVRKYGGREKGKTADLPTRLDDVIQALQETRLEIPEEFRDDAIIDISPETDSGVQMECMTIHYHRPMTEAELAETKQLIAHKIERRLTQARAVVYELEAELALIS